MTYSQQWSALIIEVLVANGVRHVCLSPGSRSGALVLAAAQDDRLTLHVHVDERSMAFFALGLAKGSRQPVAIVTTSGSAIAHVFPALIEASQCEVPLIVLTADRPPELIGVGANQAINQDGFYGKFVRHSMSLPVPSEEVELLPLLEHVFSFLGEGPIHINCPFREPFMPQGTFEKIVTPPILKRECKITRPVFPDHYPDFSRQGLIVVGYTKFPVSIDLLLSLSRKTGWKIIADAQADIRYVKSSQLVVLPQENVPLLIIGGWFVARSLLQYLKNNPEKKYQLYDTREAQNPFGNIDEIYKVPINACLSKMLEAPL